MVSECVTLPQNGGWGGETRTVGIVKLRADADTHEESLYCVGDNKQTLRKQGRQIFIQKERFLWMFAIPYPRC